SGRVAGNALRGQAADVDAHAGARVDGRAGRGVVGYPPWTRRAAREPPGVLEVRIRRRCESRHVGCQRRDLVLVARRRGWSGADGEQSNYERGRERGRYETMHVSPFRCSLGRTYADPGNAVWPLLAVPAGYNSVAFLHYLM